MSVVVCAAALAAIGAACGQGTGAPGPTTSPQPPSTSATTSAPVTPAPSASSSASASLGLVIPDGADYDPALGGRYQIVTWMLARDGHSAALLLAAAPDAPAAKYAFAKSSPAGSLDLDLRDTRPQGSSPKRVGGLGSGAIRSAKLVFPPDDALVVLHLTLAPGSKPIRKSIESRPSSSDLFVVTVKVAS